MGTLTYVTHSQKIAQQSTKQRKLPKLARKGIKIVNKNRKGTTKK